MNYFYDVSFWKFTVGLNGMVFNQQSVALYGLASLVFLRKGSLLGLQIKACGVSWLVLSHHRPSYLLKLRAWILCNANEKTGVC